MRNRIVFTLVMVVLAPALSMAAQRDGATIRNSGSTNTAGFTIAVWSDGTGNVSMQNGNPRAVVISNDLATRFFTDLQAAARSENAPPSHCMKSVSFGTTTSVAWHGWQSPDLQCPPFSPNVAALAKDVQAIEAAVGAGPGMPRRIGLPPSLRKNPPMTPEVQPT